MAGVRQKPLSSGKYQAWFYTYQGQRKFFTGTTSKRETRRMAEKLEDQHRMVKEGYRPIPTEANPNIPFADVLEEYQNWGSSHGGRGGHPWSEAHERVTIGRLQWWGEQLQLQTMSDLRGCLSDVEAGLRHLAEEKAPKTVQHYAEALRAFCRWSVDRNYLRENPIADLGTLDGTPETTRRALTGEEVQKLLAAAPPERTLLYRTALLTGLRANELRSLKVRHLDAAHNRLRLDSSWTKNRQNSFHPLPDHLAEELAKRAADADPEENLFHVPDHTARRFNLDAKKAGIPKHTPEGKIDFHALRVSYVTRIIEEGANLKEAQRLARHADPKTTMNIYAKVRQNSVNELVNSLSYDGGR